MYGARWVDMSHPKKRSSSHRNSWTGGCGQLGNDTHPRPYTKWSQISSLNPDSPSRIITYLATIVEEPWFTMFHHHLPWLVAKDPRHFKKMPWLTMAQHTPHDSPWTIHGIHHGDSLKENAMDNAAITAEEERSLLRQKVRGVRASALLTSTAVLGHGNIMTKNQLVTHL